MVAWERDLLALRFLTKSIPMRAIVHNGPRDVQVTYVADPKIKRDKAQATASKPKKSVEAHGGRKPARAKK